MPPMTTDTIRNNVAARLVRGAAAASVPVYAGTVADVVNDLKPAIPLYVYRPENLAANARAFLTQFPGEIAYAVKSNPDKLVLQTLYRAGIKAYDVASIEEVRLVRKMAPKSKIFYMHPVKSAEAIRESYEQHGVRAYVLDHKDELYKIIRNTDLAQDLELFVRVALPKNETASIDFSSKFGASLKDAADLLRTCRPVAARLGLCLHIGHQTADPQAFERALELVRGVIDDCGVTVDVLDIGGGFPVAYPGQDVPDLSAFITAIRDGVDRHGLGHMALMCEPGRAMVGTGASLIVRVEGRRGNMLYLNDGIFGGLFDAGPAMGWAFDAEAIPAFARKSCNGDQQPFGFFGPTCDSTDRMDGPFMLPADITEGDWIEIKNLGGYSSCMRSNFNGFGASIKAILLSPEQGE